jgi:hypothetical protein
MTAREGGVYRDAAGLEGRYLPVDGPAGGLELGYTPRQIMELRARAVI